MARPSKYREEYAEQAYKLCLLGATDKDMADFFEVDEATINRWKLAYDEFRESLKKGKMEADAVVAQKLYRRALGYQYDESTQELITERTDYGPIQVMAETKRVTKEVQADVTAQIFWLKNRQPQYWRDKQDIEHTGRMQHDVSLEGMTEDEINERIATEVSKIAELQARVGASPTK